MNVLYCIVSYRGPRTGIFRLRKDTQSQMVLSVWITGKDKQGKEVLGTGCYFLLMPVVFTSALAREITSKQLTRTPTLAKPNAREQIALVCALV